jgi:hypothetical protein
MSWLGEPNTIARCIGGTVVCPHNKKILASLGPTRLNNGRAHCSSRKVAFHYAAHYPATRQGVWTTLRPVLGSFQGQDEGWEALPVLPGVQPYQPYPSLFKRAWLCALRGQAIFRKNLRVYVSER